MPYKEPFSYKTTIHIAMTTIRVKNAQNIKTSICNGFPLLRVRLKSPWERLLPVSSVFRPFSSGLGYTAMAWVSILTIYYNVMMAQAVSFFSPTCRVRCDWHCVARTGTRATVALVTWTRPTLTHCGGTTLQDSTAVKHLSCSRMCG